MYAGNTWNNLAFFVLFTLFICRTLFFIHIFVSAYRQRALAALAAQATHYIIYNIYNN